MTHDHSSTLLTQVFEVGQASDPSPDVKVPVQRGAIVESHVSWDFPTGLEEEIRKRCAMVAIRYRSLIPFSDLKQEAYIWAATHPTTIATHGADASQGIAYTGWAIQSALVKLCKREHARRSHQVSYESLGEAQRHQGL